MRLYQNKLLLSLMILIIAATFTIIYHDIGNAHNIGVTGNAVTQTSVTVIPSPPSNCSTYLYAGWNIISIPCLGSYMPTQDALASINGSYTAVLGYDASNPSNPWSAYNPNLPNWTVQSLTHMSFLSGYWIEMNNDSYYYVAGNDVSSSMTLQNGWNLIGYPSKTNNSVNSTFAGIMFTELRTYDTLTSTWLVYVPSSGGNTLTEMMTYKGYWINSTSQQSLTIT